MDLQHLENELSELDRRYREWVAPMDVATEIELERKIGQNGYTEADCNYEIDLIARRQWALYSPSLAAQPMLEKLLSGYVIATPDERKAIRAIAAKTSHTTDILLRYIQTCAEHLHTPIDGDIFRKALVAASIQNFALVDYHNDICWALDDLADKARKAGIDIKSHTMAIAELSSDEQPRNSIKTMKSVLEGFHNMIMQHCADMIHLE